MLIARLFWVMICRFLLSKLSKLYKVNLCYMSMFSLFWKSCLLGLMCTSFVLPSCKDVFLVLSCEFSTFTEFVTVFLWILKLLSLWQSHLQNLMLWVMFLDMENVTNLNLTNFTLVELANKWRVCFNQAFWLFPNKSVFILWYNLKSVLTKLSRPAELSLYL